MRRILALVLVVVVANCAPAATITDLFLTENGIEDQVQSTSAVAAFETAGFPPGVGDGFVSVTHVTVARPDGVVIPTVVTPQTIAVVLAAEVVSVAMPGSNILVDFKTSTVAGFTIADLLSDYAAMATDPGLSGALPAGAAMVVLTNPATVAVVAGVTGGADPVANTAAFFTAAGGWSVEMVLGMDFFDAKVDPVLLEGNESGGFTVLEDVFGFAGSLIPVAVKSQITGVSTPHDVVIDEDSNFDTDSVPAAWQFASIDTQVRINAPTPEPGSMLVWGGLLSAVAYGGYRRRRRKAKIAE